MTKRDKGKPPKIEELMKEAAFMQGKERLGKNSLSERDEEVEALKKENEKLKRQLLALTSECQSIAGKIIEVAKNPNES